MTSPKYKSGQYLPRVKQAACVRLGVYIVLSIMCDRSEFDRPEVTITKREICEKTTLCAKTVKNALKHLRKIGAIVPIQGFQGGSGVATTYRLCIVGEGERPLDQIAQGRVCPPLVFAQWHRELGISEAMHRKRRYESGEDVE